jgi:outer membrane receptor protein involved in Fe transport
MKTLFTLLAVACSYLAVAQSNVKISGTVNDSTTNKGVEFATIALTETATGKVIDGAIADEKGNFSINKVGQGSYSIVISFIGFDTKTVKIVVDDKKDVDLGIITVSQTARTLKEVTIEAQKSLIEERVDRTIYNAENDATAKGGDATDVLKRVPMLSVDMDGNVSLRGNQNIMVLINNKPSTIVASSVADALKQIPADQIKTVEVITSPSAKYDAEGSAGIINIITKKNNLQGLTLNVDAGVGLRGSNLGLNGNYRKGKMGFSLGGWGRANYNVKGEFENTQTVDDNTISQSSRSRNQGLFGHYNLGWDYDINPKNFVAASVRFGVRNGENRQDDLARYTNGVLTSFADGISKDNSNNIDASLTYTHLYKKPQHELSFQGLYSRNNRDNVLENFNSVPFDSRLKNFNDSYNQEMTVQFDYQNPLSDNQMFELGGKTISRRAVSDFLTYTALGDGEYVAGDDSRRNNNLNYDQNVTSGYMSYTLSTKSGYSFKAGSRYEYTTINAYTKTESDIDIPSYGVIVPSVNVSKKLQSGKMIKASYNRRIQRPSIRFLNPNIQYNAGDSINYSVGVPTLSPEYTNNYELSYNTFIKGTTLNVSGFFRNTNDAIQSIKNRLPNGGIETTYANIGTENAYGMSLFANVVIGKLMLSGGSDVFYSVLDNNNPVDTLHLSNEGVIANGRIFGNYTLNKGWALQFFSFVRGRQVQLQGTQSGFYMYSLAVRKEFNEKRGSVGVGLENFLQPYIKIKNTTESPGIIQTSTNKMYNMSFRINFSYRIGKMSMDQQTRPRRRSRGINNDDLKDGGDGGMDNGGGGGQPGGGQAQAAPTGGGGRPQGQTQQTSPATPPPTIEKPAEGTVVEAAGTWTFTIDSPQGGNGTIVIKKENDVYTGTIKTDRMPQETVFTSVKVNGTEVIMNYTVSFGGNSVPVEIKTNINATDMAGTMALGTFGTFNLTGKKSQ